MKNIMAKKKILLNQKLITGDHDEKYMKIKFNSDDDFPLKKMPELHNITTRAVFHE